MRKSYLFLMVLVLGILLFIGCASVPTGAELSQVFLNYSYPRLPDPPPAEPISDVSKLNLKEIWGLVYIVDETVSKQEELSGYKYREYTVKDKEKGIYEAKIKNYSKRKFLGKIMEGIGQDLILFNKDLSLISHENNYKSSSYERQSSLKVEGNTLRRTTSMNMGSKENRDEKTYAVTEPVYILDLAGLLPLLKGIAVGRKYDVMMYNGYNLEKRTLTVESFEEVGGKSCYKISVPHKVVFMYYIDLYWVTLDGELMEKLTLHYSRGQTKIMERFKNVDPALVQKYLLERD